LVIKVSVTDLVIHNFGYIKQITSRINLKWHILNFGCIFFMGHMLLVFPDDVDLLEGKHKP